VKKTLQERLGKGHQYRKGQRRLVVWIKQSTKELLINTADRSGSSCTELVENAILKAILPGQPGPAVVPNPMLAAQTDLVVQGRYAGMRRQPVGPLDDPKRVEWRI
jgi:hypothetical protein